MRCLCELMAFSRLSRQTQGQCQELSCLCVFVQNPIAYDTVEALNEIFEPIESIFQDRLAEAESTSEAAKFFYDNYFSRLFALYKKHKDGLIKAQDFREAHLGILKSTNVIHSHR